jgi:hypothetical protein
MKPGMEESLAYRPPCWMPLLVALALLAGSAAAKDPPCARTDKACAFKAAVAHPIRTDAFWKPVLAKPVGERLGPAPAELVEYLDLENISQGFAEVPRASTLSADFLADLRGAIEDLPPVVRRVFGDTFAGVWLVDDLGGTGFTDVFLGAGGKPAGGFVILDAKVLGKFRANAWATWKENTPFRAERGWALEAKIEEGAGDDRRAAIRYILLHELGHVLSIGRDIHPRWDVMPKDLPAGERYPFFELSWTIDRAANRYVSKFENVFPLRKSVVYYLGAKLAASDMVGAYASLERTNFPTLYAATVPGDDFAESFASYVHTVLMKRPWEIVLSRDGTPQRIYRTCWEEPRCASKRRILEALLR